jgi:tRNA (guanine-N7-)-methyltransferase
MKEELQNYQNNEGVIRSFGRIKSRKLSDHKKYLLENLLPQYSIENNKMDPVMRRGDKGDNQGNTLQFVIPSHDGVHKKNILEIGFGFGDWSFEKAKNNPDINFFGSEPHINGAVNLLAKLEKEPLSNIKISRQDIRFLLQSFEDNFFDEVYILFPDPWPKAKHFKRRLINAEFLDKILAPKLKTAAKITIATDHDLYKTWILAEVLRSKKFSWNANSKKDWQIFPDDWTITKYQKKALIEGRTPVIFILNNV